MFYLEKYQNAYREHRRGRGCGKHWRDDELWGVMTYWKPQHNSYRPTPICPQSGFLSRTRREQKPRSEGNRGMAAPAHTAASVHEALLAVSRINYFYVFHLEFCMFMKYDTSCNQALQELKLIDQSLDKFEQTGEREKLAEVCAPLLILFNHFALLFVSSYDNFYGLFLGFFSHESNRAEAEGTLCPSRM